MASLGITKSEGVTDNLSIFAWKSLIWLYASLEAEKYSLLAYLKTMPKAI